MICKNCSAEYSDSYSFCPSCGTRKESGITVTTPESSDTYEEEKYVYEIPAYDGEQEGEAVSLKADGVEDSKSSAEKESVKEKAAVKSVSTPMGKEEKKAATLIIMILCIVAAVSAGLAALNIGTGTFEKKPQPQKAVALTKLSAEEETVLEVELAQYFTVFRQNFNSATSDAESFFARFNPADSGNVLSRLSSAPQTVQTEPDPAMRFADEYGEYAYYKISAAEADKILERFNLTSYGDINSKDCYYYDGFYYLNYIPTKTTPPVTAEIVKSKKVLDGSFYVECYFYIENGGEIIKSNTCYLIVEKNEEAAFDGYSFIICKSDISPLFTDAGNPTQANIGTDYTIEKKVIEGRTDDGKVYSRYTIEYPVFSEKTVGINIINQFYSGMISAYEQKTASAQKDYEDFVAQGGNAEELPFTETVITRVTYSDDSKISCVEKIAAYSPEIPIKEEETTTSQDEGDRYYDREPENEFSDRQQEEEQEPVKLFTRSVEAYTFEKATGDFVSKDTVLGKDYMVVSEILYRIYNSYDYTAVIPQQPIEETTESITDEFGNPVEQETEEYSYGYDDRDDYYGYDSYYDEEDDPYGDGVPEDEYGFGTAVYESACAFTKDGFTFWYIEDDGYVTEVTIPFDVIEKLVK